MVFLVRSINRDIKEDPSCEEYKWISPEEIVDYDFSYKKIKDFDKEKYVTIPGMEVHVRNALIMLKKNMFLDRRLFSVTDYQENKCSMNREYFEKIVSICEGQKGLEEIDYFPTKK